MEEEFRCPNCGADLSSSSWFCHCDGFNRCANLYRCHNCGAIVANEFNNETKTNTVYITEDPRKYFKKED